MGRRVLKAKLLRTDHSLGGLTEFGTKQGALFNLVGEARRKTSSPDSGVGPSPFNGLLRLT